MLQITGKDITFVSPFLQGRSSAGLERFSHIEEVIGSNPIVPTTESVSLIGGRTLYVL